MVPETISRTTAKYWEIGSKLNLERAMLQTTRMGGHFLQGHVDAVIRILKIVEYENSALFTLEIEDSLIKYIVEKGYVGIDGLSLTVAKKYSNSIDIALIPHTLSITNFSSKNENDNVNLEVDMIAKYVENFTKPHINK
jgi:riboflavin synthase